MLLDFKKNKVGERVSVDELRAGGKSECLCVFDGHLDPPPHSLCRASTCWS